MSRSAVEQLDDLEAMLKAHVQDIRDQLAEAGFDESKEYLTLTYDLSLSVETADRSVSWGVRQAGADTSDKKGVQS